MSNTKTPPIENALKAVAGMIAGMNKDQGAVDQVTLVSSTMPLGTGNFQVEKEVDFALRARRAISLLDIAAKSNASALRNPFLSTLTAENRKSYRQFWDFACSIGTTEP
jgi:hypothetical protein